LGRAVLIPSVLSAKSSELLNTCAIVFLSPIRFPSVRPKIRLRHNKSSIFLIYCIFWRKGLKSQVWSVSYGADEAGQAFFSKYPRTDRRDPARIAMHGR